MKKAKRAIAVVLCVVLLAGLVPVSAFAYSAEPVAPVTEAARVPSAGEMAALRRMVRSANRAIEFLVFCAQLTPCDDTELLLAAVEGIVLPVFAYADAIGATVVCDYVAYEIDGKTVMIDPIRVVDV